LTNTPAKIFFFLLIFLPGLLIGQETLSQIQREMARIEKETNREKKLHQNEKKKTQEFEARKKQKIAALNQQLKDLDLKKNEITKRVSQLNNQKYNYKNQIESYKKKEINMSEHLIIKIGELIVFFEKDFPHQKEKRIEQLKSLQNELKEGSLTPESGINRIFTLLEGAIELGYEAEVYSGSYTGTDGNPYEGKFLRMGSLFFAFVSIDGNKIGYQVFKQGNYVWIDKDIPLDFKQNIKDAIQIAEGKAAPELVLLPILVPEFSKGGTP